MLVCETFHRVEPHPLHTSKHLISVNNSRVDGEGAAQWRRSKRSVQRKVQGPSRIKNHLRGSKRSFCGQIYDVGRDKGDVSGRPAPMENGNKSIKGPKIDAPCNCFVLGTRRLGAKCSPTIQSTSGYLCVMCARGPTESKRMRRNG